MRAWHCAQQSVDACTEQAVAVSSLISCGHDCTPLQLQQHRCMQTVSHAARAATDPEDATDRARLNFLSAANRFIDAHARPAAGSHHQEDGGPGDPHALQALLKHEGYASDAPLLLAALTVRCAHALVAAPSVWFRPNRRISSGSQIACAPARSTCGRASEGTPLVPPPDV